MHDGESAVAVRVGRSQNAAGIVNNPDKLVCRQPTQGQKWQMDVVWQDYNKMSGIRSIVFDSPQYAKSFRELQGGFVSAPVTVAAV